MAVGQIEPISFLVGRQLALNRNLDTAAANRHGLIGAMLGPGIVGPVIARELAIREAQGTAAHGAGTVPPAGTHGVTHGSALVAPGADPGDVVNRLIEEFRAWIASQKANEQAMLDRAEELRKAAQQCQTQRTEALQALWTSAEEWQQLEGQRSAAKKKEHP